MVKLADAFCTQNTFACTSLLVNFIKGSILKKQKYLNHPVEVMKFLSKLLTLYRNNRKILLAFEARKKFFVQLLILHPVEAALVEKPSLLGSDDCRESCLDSSRDCKTF